VLKYFILTTEDLITAAIMVGMMLAYVCAYKNKKGKNIMTAGVISGFVFAAVMAYMKNATNKVDTGKWNLLIFGLSVLALLLLWLFSALHKKLKAAGDVLVPLMLAIMTSMSILYALPDVLGYPYAILMTEKSVLSTAFLFKLIGIIFGIILCVIVTVSVYHGGAKLTEKTLMLIMSLALALNAVRQITVAFSILLAKRMIASNHTLFVIAKFSTNHNDLYIYGAMVLAAVIPIILLIKSMKVNEPYSNPAEHRKIRKKWRSIRTWSVTILCCMVLSVLNMTVLESVANKPVELSPVEDAPVIDGNVVVSFDLVSDEHLHRFAYTTDNDVEIRFIVIKKPNSSSYGIGLDACDICGETGYYEKDGQVVCKLCDVVMNINTIGFKGGCNPIVIPYTIENGNILVPIDGLTEYESEFK
jgi:uncharacterized membrane protein